MLTPKQQHILNFLKKFIDGHGYAPSLQEIAAAIGISKNSKSLVSRYMHKLREAGLIEMQEGRYRHITLKKTSFAIPLIGAIAAGSPIEAIEHQEEFDITDLFVSNSEKSELFSLQVKGNSMIDEGIFDGDYIICQKTSVAQHGAIVVVLIDQQEATLKRLHYMKDDIIKLVPANTQLKPRLYKSTRITIQGLYKGLLRLQK